MAADLREIQLVELDILKVTVDTLAKHDIHPFLVAGTCLGAVRHKGFIPWDDDIDVGLLRADYEKAREILIRELPDGYSYCDWKQEKDYPYNFAKIRKNDTAFVQAGDDRLNINHGIFVDVFPFDFAPSDINAFHNQDRKAKMWRQKLDLAYMGYCKGDQKRPLWQRILIACVQPFLNREKCHKELDRIIQSYNQNVSESNFEDAYICDFLGCDNSEKEYIPYKVWGKGKEGEFEKLNFMMPADPDAHLKQSFGDYMQLPPESERVAHHESCYIDTKAPYKRPSNA